MYVRFKNLRIVKSSTKKLICDSARRITLLVQCQSGSGLNKSRIKQDALFTKSNKDFLMIISLSSSEVLGLGWLVRKS